MPNFKKTFLTCEKCEREMLLVGELPSIGDRKAARVYRCLPCQRIVSAPEGDRDELSSA